MADRRERAKTESFVLQGDFHINLRHYLIRLLHGSTRGAAASIVSLNSSADKHVDCGKREDDYLDLFYEAFQFANDLCPCGRRLNSLSICADV